MKRLLIVLAGLVAALAGCATNRKLQPAARLSSTGLFSEGAQAGKVEQALTDKDIATWLDADVRAKLPTAVAIIKFEGSQWSNRPGLVAMNSAELAAWSACLEGQDLLRGVRAIPTVTVVGSEEVKLRDLREAAGRMQCGLLLIVYQGDSAVDNYNDAAALYWTFVGLWLVPGDVVEHETIAQAVLIDSRTGAILGTTTGDCHLKRATPAAFAEIHKGKIAREAPERAMADLRAACKRMFAQLAASPSTTRPAGE